MDHEDAIGCQAAERYVAGELAPSDRDAFEEHFFDCPECAEEVRWEQIFAANARAVAREAGAARPISREPQFVVSYAASPSARNGQAPQAIAPESPAFIVHFAAPRHYGSCSYEILDAEGNRESAGILPAPATLEPEWYLQVPVQPLLPGVHLLIIRGADGGEILARFKFEILPQP